MLGKFLTSIPPLQHTTFTCQGRRKLQFEFVCHFPVNDRWSCVVLGITSWNYLLKILQEHSFFGSYREWLEKYMYQIISEWLFYWYKLSRDVCVLGRPRKVLPAHVVNSALRQLRKFLTREIVLSRSSAKYWLSYTKNSQNTHKISNLAKISFAHKNIVFSTRLTFHELENFSVEFTGIITTRFLVCEISNSEHEVAWEK